MPETKTTNWWPWRRQRPTPSSEEIHAWVDRAYRRPEGYGPMQNDGQRFTRWNMEAAFRAGLAAATKGIENV